MILPITPEEAAGLLDADDPLLLRSELERERLFLLPAALRDGRERLLLPLEDELLLSWLRDLCRPDLLSR